MRTSSSATRETNRLIIPFRPVLVHVFQSLFDYWTKKFHTARQAPRNFCKDTSGQSASMMKGTPKTTKGIDLRSHEFREQPDYNPPFDGVNSILDVEIYPIRIAA